MASMTNAQLVQTMKGEYLSGILYEENKFFLNAGTIINNGFFGSLNVVFLKAANIHLKAPGCIVAPLVNMVAKESINLGLTGKKPTIVRLYAPQALTVTTKHLSIGDISVWKSDCGAITCKKLTILLPKEEESKKDIESPDIEIIKSWVINDDTEIEQAART